MVVSSPNVKPWDLGIPWGTQWLVCTGLHEKYSLVHQRGRWNSFKKSQPQLGPNLRPPKLSFCWAAVMLAIACNSYDSIPWQSCKKKRGTTGFWNRCFLKAVISCNALLTWTLPGFGCTGYPLGHSPGTSKKMNFVQRPCWWTLVRYILEGSILVS